MSERLKMNQVIREYFRELSGEMRVCMPAKIHSYDAETQLASVQPLLKRKFYGQRDALLMPIINNVPIIHPRTATAMIRLPISQGDIVTLVFCDRSLEAWLSGDGEPVEINSSRQHHLNDAYAFLGGYPSGAAAPAVNPEALEIEVAPGTKITIGNGEDEVLSIAVEAFESLKTLCEKLSDTLTAAQLITVTAPPGGGVTSVPINAAVFATIKTAVDNLAIDVDDEITRLGNLKL